VGFASRNSSQGRRSSDIYDVIDTTVEILAIVTKSEAQAWLAQFGEPA
jgi:hypothetical protein